MMLGDQPGTLWEPRGVGWDGKWEEGLREKQHMFTYGCFLLLYGRSQGNIVKQLSSSWKINKYIFKEEGVSDSNNLPKVTEE